MQLANIIILCVMISILVTVLIWFGISLSVLIRVSKQYEKDGILLADLRDVNRSKIVEYSKDVLDFIRMMVSQVAVMKFRTFIDTNDITKINKASMERLVKEIATTVNESINISNVSLENTVYSKDFFEKYIVETSVIMVKDLLDKAIGNDHRDEE